MAIIGFINTNLRVFEDSGSLDFDIRVLRGTLRINVDVNFTTADNTAQGVFR